MLRSAEIRLSLRDLELGAGQTLQRCRLFAAFDAAHAPHAAEPAHAGLVEVLREPPVAFLVEDEGGDLHFRSDDRRVVLKGHLLDFGLSCMRNRGSLCFVIFTSLFC